MHEQITEIELDKQPLIWGSHRMKNAITLLVAGLFANVLLTLSWISAAEAQSYLPSGVYALVPNGKPIKPGILQHADVTGLQIRIDWASLEPQNNIFDWAYFDNLIIQAQAANKNVSIAVRRGLVGDGLPPWLTSEMFQCSNGTSGPIPWDSTYQNEWTELWMAIANRYEFNPTVSAYRPGGIYTWKTADWDLCDATNTDRTNWLAQGYLVDRIQDFALQFAASLSSVTTKPFIIAVASTMNNRGRVNISTTRNMIIGPLFEHHGPTALVPQVGIMRTVFSDTTGDPSQIWNTTSLGGQFQTLYDWRPHTAGQRKPGPYTLAGLQTMFDISLHYDLQFMELGTNQILFPGLEEDLSCYNNALGISGSHCVHDSAAPSDTTPPTITWINPADGSQVAGTVNLEASASDNLDVVDVKFFLDGTLLGSDLTPPYLHPWNTAIHPSGLHTLFARTVDAAGNISESNNVNVIINSAPVVNLSSPANNITVTEDDLLTMAGSANDVEDGFLTSNLSWTSSIDSVIGTGGTFQTLLSVGIHSITASVSDSVGTSASQSITVTVETADPPASELPQIALTIDGPATVKQGDNVSFTITVTNAGNSSVKNLELSLGVNPNRRIRKLNPSNPVSIAEILPGDSVTQAWDGRARRRGTATATVEVFIGGINVGTDSLSFTVAD